MEVDGWYLLADRTQLHRLHWARICGSDGFWQRLSRWDRDLTMNSCWETDGQPSHIVYHAQLNMMNGKDRDTPATTILGDFSPGKYYIFFLQHGRRDTSTCSATLEFVGFLHGGLGAAIPD